MTHIMIDLETWGKRPGCDIRSIGATVFDPSTGHIGERGTAGTFYIATDNPFEAGYDPHMAPPINFDTGDQYSFDQVDAWRKYPLIRDGRTVEWWNHPDRSEAATAFTNPVDLREALQTFAIWLMQMQADPMTGKIDDPAPARLWAHGPTFDVSILAAAYEAVGLPIPWHYRAPRDTRTIMEAAGIGLEQFSTGTHHHALDDAICQAGAVCEAYRLINEWRSTHDCIFVDMGCGGDVERLIDEAPHGWIMYGPDGNWHWANARSDHEAIDDQRPATSLEKSLFNRFKNSTEHFDNLNNGAREMLTAFAEGIEWTDEKRRAYTTLDRLTR